MGKAGAMAMAMHMLSRMKVIQAPVDGNLRLKLAAERRGLLTFNAVHTARAQPLTLIAHGHCPEANRRFLRPICAIT